MRTAIDVGLMPAWLPVEVDAVGGGGVIACGSQLVGNVQTRGFTASAFTDVDLGEVAVGAAGGAVGAGTFGMGTAALGTSLAGRLGASALSGTVSGQAARATGNVASGKCLTSGLGDPGDLALDAAFGAAGGGTAYRVTRVIGTPTVTNLVPSRLATAQNATHVGRAPELLGGAISESGFLRVAQSYLGPGYRSISPGRYVSADGMRQVRYGRHDTTSSKHHAHFEAFDRPYLTGGRVIENTSVNILPD